MFSLLRKKIIGLCLFSILVIPFFSYENAQAEVMDFINPTNSIHSTKDPDGLDYTWLLKQIDQYKNNNLGISGKGVKVEIIDTGIDKRHPEFAGKTMIYKNFIPDDPDGEVDHEFHGTAMAAVVAGNNLGVAKDATLYIAKAQKDGVGKIIEAIQWGIDNHVDIISISQEWTGLDIQVQNIFENAFQQGILIVGATGNILASCDDRTQDEINLNKTCGSADLTKNTVNYPALFTNTIAVGAVEQNVYGTDQPYMRSIWRANGARLYYSAAGQKMEVVGPGSDNYMAWSAYQTNKDGLSSDVKYFAQHFVGTSTATAYVAGVLALLKEQYPFDTNKQLKEKLHQLAQQQPLHSGYEVNGNDVAFGYGYVNARLLEQPITGINELYTLATNYVDVYSYPSLQANKTTINAGTYTINKKWQATPGTTGVYNWYCLVTPNGDKWIRNENVAQDQIIKGIKAGPKFANVLNPYFYDASYMQNVLKGHENWYYQTITLYSSYYQKNIAYLYYSPYPFNLTFDSDKRIRLTSSAPNKGQFYHASVNGSGVWTEYQTTYGDIKNIYTSGWNLVNQDQTANMNYDPNFTVDVSSNIRANGASNVLPTNESLKQSIINQLMNISPYTPNDVYKKTSFNFYDMKDILDGNEHSYYSFVPIKDASTNTYKVHVYYSLYPFEIAIQSSGNSSNPYVLKLTSAAPDTSVLAHGIVQSDGTWFSENIVMGSVKGGTPYGLVNGPWNPGNNGYPPSTFIAVGAQPIH